MKAIHPAGCDASHDVCKANLQVRITPARPGLFHATLLEPLSFGPVIVTGPAIIRLNLNLKYNAVGYKKNRS